MTEENNKEINPHAARDEAIIEALKKNDPFVLPSLEELRVQFNNEKKDLSNEYACDSLHINSDQQREEVKQSISDFEKETGILLPQEYKDIQLKYHFGFMIGDLTAFLGCEELLFSLEDWIELRDQPGGELLEDSIKIGESDFLHYFMNVKDNKIYICNYENPTEYRLIADSFELF